MIVEARFMVTKDFNFSPPRDLLSNDTFLCVRLDGWMDGWCVQGGRDVEKVENLLYLGFFLFIPL